MSLQVFSSRHSQHTTTGAKITLFVLLSPSRFRLVTYYSTTTMLDLIPSSLLFLLFFVVQGVAAMGAMDVIALILGLTLLIFGICALIGFYARRRAG